MTKVGALLVSSLVGVLLLPGFAAAQDPIEKQIYDDPARFEELSGAKRTILELKYGKKGGKTPGSSSAARPVNPNVAPANVLANDNAGASASSGFTQSETSIAVFGSTVLTSFNDSGSNAGSAPHFTGWSRSTDSGATFADLGVLPLAASGSGTGGDAGDPVFARNNTTGRIYLATLCFNNGEKLLMFRSDDGGATWLDPVNATPGYTSGTGSQDKEWIAVDNFAGPGNGNVYMFWRNFGSISGMTFIRSTDHGTTWGPNPPSHQLLLSGSGQGAYPVVAADHSVYAFWFDSRQATRRLMFRKSTDQGVTFAAEQTAASLLTTGTNGDLGLAHRTSAFPQIVAHPTNANFLYMVFPDNPAGADRGDIFLTASTDAGNTWTTPARVNKDTGTNDQWQPTIAITPDGTKLFMGWYDRRNDVANNMIDTFGIIGTVSGSGVVTLPSCDFKITTQSFPPVVGADGVINATYMGDYDQAVADSSFFYYSWADNRLPLGARANQPDVRVAKIPLTGPAGPDVQAVSAAITAESCAPTNSKVDPGETVTINVCLNNSGLEATANLVATLQATGGVTSPSAAQNYGVVNPLCPSGTNVCRTFTFTAAAVCGANVVATIQLQDGATNLGTVSFTFPTGLPGPLAGSFTTGNLGNTIVINDNATVEVPIVVTGSGNLGKTVVKVRGNHTFTGDIELSVVHPDGTVIVLSDNRGGGGDNFGTGANDCTGTKTVFDDAAATAIAAGTPPYAGSFRPDSALAALNGKPIAGTWKIRIQDTAGGDTGNLFCADIDVFGLECCSGGGGNTAPGISAFGPFTRVAGAPGTVSVVANVTDVQDAPGTLTVTQIAGGTATGITTTAITNLSGAITANLAAACAATSGTVRFQVTDSGALSSTADVTVNVTGGVDTTITAPASACQNATGLAASVPAGPMGTTYTWTINNGGTITGGQGTNAITFSVATATPVQLGVTVASGSCNGSSTKNVVVNAPPSATITAPAAVCAASTGNTASVPNAGMGATYVWTATGGTITGGQGTNAITFTATAAAPGPVALGVTVTASGCNGTGNVNVPVTALPTAPTITGNTNLCVGGGLTLTASAGYTSYLWSKDGNPIVGQTAQTYTKSGLVAGDAGLYRVQGVLSGCTSADSAPTTVVVSGTCPAPTVTVVSPICAGMVGGKDITITGTGFQPGATVKLIGTTATNVVVVSSTQITCKAGARAAGAALQGDVLVTNPDAQFGKLVDGFFYAVRGDANNNGSVTGADSFYLNQAIFLGGPAPATLCNGDANSSNATTGADSFFLNLFIFLGGPPPGP